MKGSTPASDSTLRERGTGLPGSLGTAADASSDVGAQVPLELQQPIRNWRPWPTQMTCVAGSRRQEKGWIMKVKLPKPVAAIYKAVEELEQAYPGRKFTPDGHLVGSIGEVVAAEALGLTLYAGSHPGNDAYDANGDVQIKMTSSASISLYATCTRLVVLKVENPEEAEIVYDGPGEPAWAAAGKLQKNGQRIIRLSKLKRLTR
jgi:Family of unknown function (DUF6998)